MCEFQTVGITAKPNFLVFEIVGIQLLCYCIVLCDGVLRNRCGLTICCAHDGHVFEGYLCTPYRPVYTLKKSWSLRALLEIVVGSDDMLCTRRPRIRRLFVYSDPSCVYLKKSWSLRALPEIVVGYDDILCTLRPVVSSTIRATIMCFYVCTSATRNHVFNCVRTKAQDAARVNMCFVQAQAQQGITCLTACTYQSARRS